MAQYLLVEVRIIDPFDEAFEADDVLEVLWDDVGGFRHRLNGNTFVTPSTLGEQGKHYLVTDGITSVDKSYLISGYSFCDSAHLVWFRMPRFNPEYPFMQQRVTTNSPVCSSSVVCDIRWIGNPIIVHATDKSTGGTVTVTAESSNSAVKYGLRDSSYDLFDNTTGVFTGLAPGDWIIYAKDLYDCTIWKLVKVLYQPTDQEHYRFTWASQKIGKGESRDARIRIYEREYVGDVVEIDFGDVSPFNLNKPRRQGQLNEKFYPIHPTNATIRLFSIRDYQFLPLFTQDNEKYLVVYEVDEGDGFAPVWQGFVNPNTYREDFERPPYLVELAVQDNLSILEQTPFTDDDGNLIDGNIKLIKVIALILKKTGLLLKIRSGINIFEANHDTDPQDDPLDQTYIDVACYRREGEPFTCWEVLECILRPFGARLFQYRNMWIIEEIDTATEEYAYRIFSVDGDYESNGTFDPIIDVKAPTFTDRAALINRDHSLEVVPAYGQITIASKLNYIGSIVAGGFEKTDLLVPDAEEFSVSQGVYTSEEGFRDWTLRLNGTTGVSFGRVEVSNRGDSPRIGLTDVDDPNRSVGAFFYNPSAWSGNLRNAYIESAEKPYQYGPGDEMKLTFEYSTPAKPEYEFMVLRMMLKVGDNYLQPDKTWDTTEAIYRAYPKVSNSLQRFELSVPVPETNEVIDSTVQIRIYFYAAGFYDYGLPTPDSDASNGTDGISDLKEFPTSGILYDYNVDVRNVIQVGSLNIPVYLREFYQLRIAVQAEDISGGVVQPDDYHADNNPRIWHRLKAINIQNDEENTRRRGTDVKFYVDNVSLDALINGQPPPLEDVISLSISKYISSNLEVQLYNFDVPNITNAKNMYNNYFRLSDGTPTSAWTRKGVAESIPLQHILLKVLVGNHSAPTFRVTGSLLNEFARIGIDNYIRITKPGSDMSISNGEFDSDLEGWEQFPVGFSDRQWSWTSDNGGSAEVTMNSSDHSWRLVQDVIHSGGYINIEVNLKVIPQAATTREDTLFLVFMRGGDTVHTEQLKVVSNITSEQLYEFNYKAYCPQEIDAVGFFIKHSSGSGTNVYQVGTFKPEGTSIQEVYQIVDYESEERRNRYFFELMQLSKTYISLAGVDIGENNQSGGEVGREHSSAYSSAYS